MVVFVSMLSLSFKAMRQKAAEEETSYDVAAAHQCFIVVYNSIWRLKFQDSFIDYDTFELSC